MTLILSLFLVQLPVGGDWIIISVAVSELLLNSTCVFKTHHAAPAYFVMVPYFELDRCAAPSSLSPVI